MLVPVAMGLGFAALIHAYGSTSAYNQKIGLVIKYDMHYAYLACVVIFRLTEFLNMLPTVYKARFMTPKSGNLRSNMYIYREHGSDKVVVLDDGPNTGKYNRANRSLHHYVENVVPLCMSTVLAAFCFPAPTLALVCAFALGRVWHQVAYTKGYGAHAPGFATSILASTTVEGLCLFVGLKGLAVL